MDCRRHLICGQAALAHSSNTEGSRAGHQPRPTIPSSSQLGFGLSFRGGQDKVWARLRERGSGQRTQNWAEIFAETRGPRQHQAAGLLRCNHDANLFGDQLRGCARQSVVLPTNPQPYARQRLARFFGCCGSCRRVAKLCLCSNEPYGTHPHHQIFWNRTAAGAMSSSVQP